MGNAQIAEKIIDDLASRIELLEDAILQALICIDGGDLGKGIKILNLI